jgi:hypothetical protein
VYHPNQEPLGGFTITTVFHTHPWRWI